MFSCKKIVSACNNPTNVFRYISSTKISFRGFDKWKKLIDCNWLKPETYRKKLIKQKPAYFADPCIKGAILAHVPPPPDPEPKQPLCYVPKTSVSSSQNNNDHPVLKPQCDIPLPSYLCTRYFQEPYPVLPQKIPPEIPSPYGPAIDTPKGEILQKLGFCPEIVFPKKLSEVVKTKEELEEEKKRSEIQIPVQEIKIFDISGIPTVYQKDRLVYICKFSKNLMQSGTHNTHKWVLKFNVQETWENPTMGWTSTGDGHSSYELSFDSSEQAIAFCKKYSYKWQLLERVQKKASTKKKAYADIFSWNKRTRASTK